MVAARCCGHAAAARSYTPSLFLCLSQDALQHKTRILAVSSHMDLVSRCDRVIVVGPAGGGPSFTVLAYDSPEAVRQRFPDLFTRVTVKEEQTAAAAPRKQEAKPAIVRGAGSALVQKEDKRSGACAALRSNRVPRRRKGSATVRRDRTRRRGGGLSVPAVL